MVRQIHLPSGQRERESHFLSWYLVEDSLLMTSPVLARMLISMVYRRCGIRSWRERNREGQGQKTAVAGPQKEKYGLKSRKSAKSSGKADRRPVASTIMFFDN